MVDVSRQVANSCGDLIFSSHMTFILMGECVAVCTLYVWHRQGTFGLLGTNFDDVLGTNFLGVAVTVRTT